MKNIEHIKAKVDELLPLDKIKYIKSLWVECVSPCASRIRVNLAGIDSGFNYIEYRGYALYVVDVALVMLKHDGEELYEGDVDVDLFSSNNIEHELFIKGIELETKMLKRSIKENQNGLILVDGSLLAKSSTLLRTRGELELVKNGKMKKPSEILREMLEAVSKLGFRTVFVAKNSSSRDILGFAKGDVYYFEKYTDGVPGYAKPVLASRISGVSSLISKLRAFAGIHGIEYFEDVAISYLRLKEGGRVYRVEIPVNSVHGSENVLEDVKHHIKLLMRILEQGSVGGYPYVLLRADELARITHNDIKRLAGIAGILLDPSAREPLREVFIVEAFRQRI